MRLRLILLSFLLLVFGGFSVNILAAVPESQRILEYNLQLETNSSSRDYEYDIATPTIRDSVESSASTRLFFISGGLSLLNRINFHAKIGESSVDNGTFNIGADEFKTNGNFGLVLGADGSMILFKNFLGVDWVSRGEYLDYRSDFRGADNNVTEYSASFGFIRTLDNLNYGAGLRFSDATQEIEGTTRFGQPIEMEANSLNNLGGYFKVDFKLTERFEIFSEITLLDENTIRIGSDFSFSLIPFGIGRGTANFEKERITSDEEIPEGAPDWKKSYLKGRKSYASGKYTKARQQLQKTLETFPGHQNALFYLGLTELKLESVDKSQALDRFKLLLQLNPDHQAARNLLKKHQKNS